MLGRIQTPTFRVNGRTIDMAGVRTADDFEKALFAAAK